MLQTYNGNFPHPHMRYPETEKGVRLWTTLHQMGSVSPGNLRTPLTRNLCILLFLDSRSLLKIIRVTTQEVLLNTGVDDPDWRWFVGSRQSGNSLKESPSLSDSSSYVGRVPSCISFWSTPPSPPTFGSVKTGLSLLKLPGKIKTP